MNKDLDERLVPNGEYRDALNIKVSTSEGSNVGSVQNILGNIKLSDMINTNPEPGFADLRRGKCVGAIADEKENCLYWFIAFPLPLNSTNRDVYSSYILKYKDGIVTPIVVDRPVDPVYFFDITGEKLLQPLGFHKLFNYEGSGNGFEEWPEDQNPVITGINVLDGLLFWTDNVGEPKKINIENCRLGTPDFNTHTKCHNPLLDSLLQSGRNGYSDSSVFLEEKHVTVIKKAPSQALTLELTKADGLNPPGIIDKFRFAGNVTDANGVDIMTLWSPGNYPQASNGVINFVIRNTSATQDYTIIPGQTIIYLKSASLVDIGFDTGSDGFADELQQSFNQEYSYLSNYDIRLQVTSINTNLSQSPLNTPLSGYIDVHCEILNIRAGTSINFESWIVGFEQAADTLFEEKFPRFAYRYKYIDGEYSPISPFTDVAFLPNVYSNDPVQGFNVGMKNYLSKVTLKDFVLGDAYNTNPTTGAITTIETRKINHDVVGVDLLYKESNSPNVYIVDSVDATNPKWYLSGTLSNTGVYEITSDTIFKAIPSNQLLRPFDSVPKKALAQEITGNRIVYGNYVQNLNLNGKDKFYITPTFNFGYLGTGGVVDEIGDPSIKSLRNYQIGVVYEDKYGRQTPVLTSENATLNLPITTSTRQTKFYAAVTSEIPAEAESYKFFIKETSNEYYNLALHKYYEAEDGNLWLSFNSADRNKVDEETYLYLKKEHGSDRAVNTPNKYKILAIENNAPEYVLQTKNSLGNNIFHSSLQTNLLFNDSTFYPLERKTEFRINTLIVESTGLADIAEKEGLVMRLSIPSTNDFSKTYTITNVIKDALNPQGYVVSIKGDFGSDVNFIEASSSTASSPVLKNNVFLEIFETKQDVEIDGKFFVKIFRDFNVINYLEPFSSSSDNYSIVHQEPLYFLNTATPNLPCLNTSLGNNWDNQGVSQSRASNYDLADAVADATNLFGDGTTSDTLQDNGPKWFIDKAPYQGEAVYDSTTGDLITTIPNYPNEGVNNGIDGSKIDISYSGIRSSAGTYALGNRNFWQVGEGNSNTETDHEVTMVRNLTTGSRFYFADDPNKEIFTITGVAIKKIYNYVSFVSAGSGFLNAEAYFSFSGNFRKTWKLTLDKDIPSTFDPLSVSNPPSSTVTSAINFIKYVDETDNSIVLNPAVFETKPKDDVDLDIYHEITSSYDKTFHGTTHILDWFNCYVFGNGVESDRIQDDFNAATIDNGPKVSTVFEGDYKEDRIKNGLIYSGIYNSKNSFNATNQFISAEKITKNLNPVNGSIQKLHSRDGDLIALCEDKVLRILANKDAIFNADGNVQLTANENVLGQAIPFAGDYGISTDPGSFVTQNFRSYFTDRQRGAVLRLSRDGLTPISEYGMSDYFSDNLKTTSSLLGSYDNKNDEYNVTLIRTGPEYGLVKTVSFNEKTNGWSSFKSFTPEFGLSFSNDYYTFKNGALYQHDLGDYNTFYGDRAVKSSITILLNDVSSSVKNFKTINYEGSQSKVYAETSDYRSGYYNLIAKPGWSLDKISTDRETGTASEFIKKEGKWFNFIKGARMEQDVLAEAITNKFSFQGIGKCTKVIT